MSNPVPFVTIDRQHAILADELRAAYDRVAANSGFILGPDVPAFEEEFAAFSGARHCVGVASGTAALVLALQAAGIGPGDEVIVPAHTFIASALGVVHAGATPVFCDVEEGTGLIDAASAEQAVTERTAGIIAVHLYGQMCDMDALQALAARHGLKLFEDAAQAHGATWRGQTAGSIGTATGFSFYPSKNLGALGDGGAITTNDDEVAARARALRNIGQLTKGEHLMIGWNERLDGLQAAFLRVKLPHLAAGNAARRRHAELYRDVLAGAVTLLEERPESPCVYHLFPIRVPDRDAVAAALNAQGIHTGVHYHPAMPDHAPFAGARTVGDVPVARRWADETVSLPMGPELTEDEVRRAAETVLRVVDRAAAKAA